MMISSYCLRKLKLVNWYLELLEVDFEKYIVPQSRPHLEMIRGQLMECRKEIMRVKIANPCSSPIIDIQYSKEYVGQFTERDFYKFVVWHSQGMEA